MSEVASISEESLKREWWAKWWDADYSWDGLAKKRWRGWWVTPDEALVKGQRSAVPDAARPATLRDLWREEKAFLIEDPTGRLWTRVHAPETWQGGEPEKAAWTRLERAVIEDAIEAALMRLPADAFNSLERPAAEGGQSTYWRLSVLSGVWPIPLDGAVLFGLPKALEGRTARQARQTAFLDQITLSSAEPTVELESCLFVGGVEAQKLKLGDVRFIGCTAINDISFSGTRARYVSLEKSTFVRKAELDRLDVTGTLRLRRASFRQGLGLRGLKARKLQSERIEVSRALDLGVAVVDEVVLANSTFGGEVSFAGARTKSLDLSRCVFHADVSNRGLVGERGDFSTTTWAGKLTFSDAVLGSADFSEAKFASSARFSGAKFPEKFTFSGARFEGAAYFADVEWPAPLAHHAGAFREAHFERFADFSHPCFEAFAAFDGAVFKGEVRFSTESFQKDRGFKRALARAGREKQWDALGHGVRTLKQAAEAVRDRRLEQRLFRYELVVRRSRPDTGGGEKLVSHLYRLASDYGNSLWRPLVAAVLLWLVGAGVYLGLGLATGKIGAGLALSGRVHPAALEALQLSARSIFSLFGIWSSRSLDLDKGAVLERAILWGNPCVALLVRVLSSLQSVAAGVLLFLAGLAIRRRFQIN